MVCAVHGAEDSSPLLLTRIPRLQTPVGAARRTGDDRRGDSLARGRFSPGHRFHEGLAPTLEDEGGAQVAQRRGDDGDCGDGEDRADHAVEGGPRERGEEDPQGVDAHGAAHDPRHQDISFELLGDEEEAGDQECLPETAHEERYKDRRDGAEKGPEDGDDLRDANPEADHEGVSPDREEGYGRAYDPHDGAERQLRPEVLYQGAFDSVEELDDVVAHRIGDRTERGAGDPLPVEEEVDGDYQHQNQVQHAAEDAEDPADEPQRATEDLPGGGGVALEELDDDVLVYRGYIIPHVVAHVGNIPQPRYEPGRPLHEGRRVADHGLYLPDGRDYEYQECGRDGEEQGEGHAHHRHDPRDAPPLETPHHGVEDVGKDGGHQEREQDSAQLADEEHEQEDAHRDQDILKICRDDQLFGGHPGLRSRTLKPRIYQSQGIGAGRFTAFTPLCIILPQDARGKRAEGPTRRAEAGGFAATPTGPPENLEIPPVRPIPGNPLRTTRRRRCRQPRRAARGQTGGSGRCLPAAAHHGRVPAALERAGAHLRGVRPDPGLHRGGAHGPHRPEQRRPRHGFGGGRRGRDLDPHPSGEPHGARLPSGG